MRRFTLLFSQRIVWMKIQSAAASVHDVFAAEILQAAGLRSRCSSWRMTALKIFLKFILRKVAESFALIYNHPFSPGTYERSGDFGGLPRKRVDRLPPKHKIQWHKFFTAAQTRWPAPASLEWFFF
jgi:hypothetical protein